MSEFASLALIGFTWLALFQLLLAAGAPLGHMAWGGQHRVLPKALRWGSLGVVALAGLGMLTVAQADGSAAGLLPEIFLRPLLGSFAVLFALSTASNAASASRAERLHGVPLAAILAVSCAVLFFA